VGLDGMEPLYGGESSLITSLLQAVHPGFNPRVGVPMENSRPIAAVISDGGRAAKAPENVSDFLRRFSINLLPISRETKTRLLHLGLHNLGQIAGQPVGAMQAQFGPEDLRAWELSRGIDRRPLFPGSLRKW
jgi:hypothetical protein